MKIKYEKAFFKNLPVHLKGLKILHISDLHSNSCDTIHKDIWTVIDTIDFDMAVMTGDMVLSHCDEIDPHISGISKLAKACPVFYVEGNHDTLFFDELAEKFETAGVIVLKNKQINYEVKNFGFVSIIGTRDYKYLFAHRFSGIDELLSPHAGKFNIVLTHQPQLFDRIKKYDLGLMLCGHTHGGQVRLPLMPTLYAPGQGVLPKYGDGWYSFADSKLYISRGIGTTHFPLRIFNSPEISVIELIN